MIQIAWPWIFLLFPFPWILRLLLPKASLAEGLPVYAPFVFSLQRLEESEEHVQSRRWRFASILIIWLLLLCAGSRPQWLGEPLELPETGRSLILSVDISGSMEIPDLDFVGGRSTRLDVIKSVAGNFIERRSGDRIGLILFGTYAYLQAPLTFDRMTVWALLQDAEIGMAGKNTAIGDAIGLAIKRLKDSPEGQAALVLLTDGANTAGVMPPRQAADLAAQAGLRIYTIGVGADSMYVQGLLGSVKVNPSKDLDEDTLKYIAETTGGQYFRARDKKELEDIYFRLDQLEPLEAGSRVVRPVKALYHWPLGVALLLSMLWLFVIVLPFKMGRE